MRNRTRRAQFGLLVLLWSVTGGVAGFAGSAGLVSGPPHFSDEGVRKAADELERAWSTWNSVDRGLEMKVLRLPMTEAREALQIALGRYLDYLDKRRVYGEAVAVYIDRVKAEPRAGQHQVTLEAVFQDEIVVLGTNMSALQAKLASLRSTGEWISIRRAVQMDSDKLLALQASRRDEIPVDLSIRSTRNPSPISKLVYRDSERQTTDVLEKLWTRYYQALVDSVEQRPGGPVPLTATRPGTMREPSPVNATPRSTGAAANPLDGVWIYVPGAQEFNGIAEPRQVLLELAVENGVITGHYRADLPDFRGVLNVDLRLRGFYKAGSSQQLLDAESRDLITKGQITLEGPGGGGAELMLVRGAFAGNQVPKGREVLRKR